MATIIGISGISGSGKTTLAKSLCSQLKVTGIFWDDYDEISEGPSDYIRWYNSGQDYSAWKYPELAFVLKQLKSNVDTACPLTGKKVLSQPYVVFDAPLGRKHTETGRYIDFLIHMDTPLDVALGRRLLRDFSPPSKSKDDILEDLHFYLLQSRPLFFSDDIKEDADLIIDGTLSTKKQNELALKALSTYHL